MPAWDPWVALRARPHVELRLDPVAALLGGGMLVRIGERAVITLDPALDGRSRRVALAHELIHDERGGGCDEPGTPAGWDAVVARDEAAVDREVARRLVPAAGLRRWLEERFSVDDAVALWEVAEAFDVDEATAARALSFVDAHPTPAG
ncbi:MAG: hypothetical protein HYX34_12350 [Actinobacteria bacterium]|nr:hypothetical protein [Actinomycetota bacterium]